MAEGTKTGGRTAGTPNKRTAEVLAAVEATGITPLAYMLGVLQSEEASDKDRQWAAEKSAPYLHPRPMPQPRSVEVELPDTSTPAGVAEAIGAVLVATSRGQLAPSEGRDLVALLEARLKAIESTELEQRIKLLEERSAK